MTVWVLSDHDDVVGVFASLALAEAATPVADWHDHSDDIAVGGDYQAERFEVTGAP